MKTQKLTDAHGQVLGYIDTGDDGRQILKDEWGQVCGYYYPFENATKDAHGDTVGYGNILTSLLHRR